MVIPIGRVAFFVAAMAFAVVANAAAFFVLFRMRSIGYRIGLWRTIGKDLGLYREYWRIAPFRNWSPTPLLLAIASLVVAVIVIAAAFWGH